MTNKLENLNNTSSSFKRWSRKGWAIFNSLHRNVKIGTLSLTCLIITLPGKTQNKPDTSSISKTMQMDSVVISARRTPAISSKLTRPVQILSKEEIHSLPGATINEVLEFVPGVDIRSRGAFGTQADVSIRGGSFDQTMVLINGINFTDPQTGHHALNLPIDPQAIERIEVLSGPAARVFGANAYNGVINILTKPTKQDKLSVALAAGDFNWKKASATLHLGTSKFRHLFSGTFNNSDGFTKNTDFQTYSLFYQNQLTLKDAFFELQAGFSDRQFGANAFYSPKYPDQWEETKTINTSIKGIFGSLIRIKPSIYWRRNYDHFELFRYEAASWYAGHNNHRTDVIGSQIQASKEWWAGTTTVAVDYRYEFVISNVLGTPLAEPVKVPGEEGSFYTKSDFRDLYSISAEHTVEIGRFNLSAGLLGQYIPRMLDKMRFYPGIDAGYKLSDHLFLKAAFNRTLRLPTFTDLYYTSATNISNPDLKPEEASTWEAGVKLNHQKLNIEINGFLRDGQNMIDWIYRESDQKWLSVNYGSVIIKGVDVVANYTFTTPGHGIKIERIRAGYTYQDANKDEGKVVSKYILDILRHKADLSTTLSYLNRYELTAKVSYQERTGEYIAYPTGELVKWKGHLLADIHLQARIWKTNIFIEASNLFDTKYVDHANVPQPGRWFRCGLTFNTNI
ncbi:MAG: TonB-dependent receptor [Sphingobacteriia bacterium]|nr:TonB-dependent receptor [Sphingobacteriia bacterium]